MNQHKQLALPTRHLLLNPNSCGAAFVRSSNTASGCVGETLEWHDLAFGSNALSCHLGPCGPSHARRLWRVWLRGLCLGRQRHGRRKCPWPMALGSTTSGVEDTVAGWAGASCESRLRESCTSLSTNSLNALMSVRVHQHAGVCILDREGRRYKSWSHKVDQVCFHDAVGFSPMSCLIFLGWRAPGLRTWRAS